MTDRPHCHDSGWALRPVHLPDAAIHQPGVRIEAPKRPLARCLALAGTTSHPEGSQLTLTLPSLEYIHAVTETRQRRSLRASLGERMRVIEGPPDEVPLNVWREPSTNVHLMRYMTTVACVDGLRTRRQIPPVPLTVPLTLAVAGP